MHFTAEVALYLLHCPALGINSENTIAIFETKDEAISS